MTKILAITAVNLRRFLGERSNIFFVFVFPIALILIVGVTFGSGFSPRVGVVADGDDPHAARFVALLEAGDDLDVVRVPDEETLVDRVESGALSAGVVVPADFGAALGEGRTTEVGFVARPEGSGPQLRLPVAAAVATQMETLRAAIFVADELGIPLDTASGRVDQLADRTGTHTVSVERTGEQLFGEDLGPFDLGAPAQMVLFTFLTGLTASAALIQSRQLGVSRRMLSTPTSTTSIVLGETGGRLAVVLFQGGYIMVATAVLFGVDWGDPLGAAALLVTFSLVGAGAGLLMGAVFSNDQQASGIGVIVGLILAAIGGCMVPLELFSETVTRIAHLTPHAWALDGFAELVRHDGGIADIGRELAVLAGFATVLLGLASWRLRVTLTRS